MRGNPDIGWFAPDGTEMSEDDWEKGFAKSLGVFLNGDAIPSVDPRGEPVRDDSFLVLLNAHYEPLDFVMPDRYGQQWSIVLDTADALPPSVEPMADQRLAKANESLAVADRSIQLLRRLA
jgi:glycogen operon protein